jgi:hypothetical protein
VGLPQGGKTSIYWDAGAGELVLPFEPKKQPPGFSLAAGSVFERFVQKI